MIADYFDANSKMLGLLMEKEVQAVDNILSNIKRPFTAIMGGSKVSTKIGIIENLMDKVDNLILCGGMTYTFAKAQGGNVGNSICEEDKLDLALDVMGEPTLIFGIIFIPIFWILLYYIAGEYDNIYHKSRLKESCNRHIDIGLVR